MTTSTRRSRLVRLVGFAAASAVVAVGCGGNDPSAVTTASTAAPATTAAPTDSSAPETTGGATETTAAPTTVPAPEPQSGGAITVALDAESTGFNPTADAWANGGHNVAKAIFDPLAAYDGDGRVVPYLAESITANDDATVWTITLRPGVSFHNGEPLNADAVRLNFETSLASPTAKDQLALVASMDVVDDLTLQVTMSQPWGTFLTKLVGDVGSQVGYMAAPAMLASPDGGRSPIGTGPFVFQEWVPDDRLVVVRNDAYWQRPAYLDQVTFRPIPDSTARKAAFDAGDVDVFYTGSPKDVGEYLAMQDAGEVNVTLGAPSSPDMILYNTTKAPLDDVRVRLALTMAIDVDRLFEYSEGLGVKQPMYGPYATDSFWYVETDYPRYDIAAAATLIDEYVAEKGEVVFDFAGGQDPWLVGYQELIQSMWAEIGVTANIVSRAQAENIGSVLNNEFQVVLWGNIGGGDPDNDYQYFHSGTGLNFGGYNSPTIDAAMEAGRATGDPDERKEQYAIVQRELAEAMPYAWQGTNQLGAIAGAAVLGISDFTLPDEMPGEPMSAGHFFLKDAWLAA